MTFTESLAWGSLFLWGVLFLLPWLPWRNREILNATTDSKPDLDEITVVIPARNESDVILRTLEGLANQSDRLKVVVIDDNSEDGTAALASKSSLVNLEIVEGKQLSGGWSGKLWAQNQGLELVSTPLVLSLDADIYLDDGILATLARKKQDETLHFVSLRN